MAEGNHIHMQSDNENKDQLLMSNNENSPRQPERGETPPRDQQDRHRRTRRMNQQEQDIRERARDRHRRHRDDRSPRRHRTSSGHREDLNNRNPPWIDRQDVRRQQDTRHLLRRSK